MQNRTPTIVAKDVTKIVAKIVARNLENCAQKKIVARKYCSPVSFGFPLFFPLAPTKKTNLYI